MDEQEQRRINDRIADEQIHKMLNEILKDLDSTGAAQNILLVGTTGAGKSSFVNTGRAVLSGEWKPKAQVSSSGKEGAPVTTHLNWHCRFGLDEDPSRVNAHNIPHVADIAGLPNEDTPAMSERFELLVDGFIDPQTSFPELIEYQKKGVGRLRRKYCKSVEHWRMSKIVFIASATEDLPENLIKCLRRVARSNERWIPMFGLLSKCDRIREDVTTAEKTTKDEKDTILKDIFERKEERFRELIGIGKDQYARLYNYTDGSSFRNPQIDIRVLQFLKRLFEKMDIITPKPYLKTPLEESIRDKIEYMMRKLTVRSGGEKIVDKSSKTEKPQTSVECQTDDEILYTRL